MSTYFCEHDVLAMQNTARSAQISWWIIFGLVAIAAASRLLPHPPNFTPVIAMALFSGAALPRPWQAVGLTLGAMLAADLVLGWHSSLAAVYLALALVCLIGQRIHLSSSASRIAGHGLGGALLFFVLTNFAVWASSGMYPLTVAGLIECYTLAIPFFGNTLAGTAMFGLIMFGLVRQHPALKSAASAA